LLENTTDLYDYGLIIFGLNSITFRNSYPIPRLRNVPSVFQRFIQDVLFNFIGSYVLVYLNDIIIYSTSLNEHIKYHLCTVLNLLINNGLYVKLEKCDVHIKETMFLGFVVSTEGLSMDNNILKSILDWPVPKNVKELLIFLGLCNFYRKLINNLFALS